MITSFDIENFRCFKQASLNDLRKINIIVGDNASGKTAFGEAIAMAAAAHPGLGARIRLARSRSLPEQINWDRNQFESFYDDLFYNFDISSKIVFQFNDVENGHHKVEIYYDKSQSMAMGLLTSGFVAPLIFSRTDSFGNINTIKLEIDGKGGLKSEGNLEALPSFYALSATQLYHTIDIVNYFGEIKKSGEGENVIKAFQKEFPLIEDIEILPDMGISSLYAKLRGVKKPRPLTIVSAGAAKYLNILLSIAFVKEGIVMVDEIENGIYWKKMPKIWQTLRNFCNYNNVQLFAATHSNECIQALLPIMNENVEDFSLIRTEVDNNGDYKIRQFYGKSFRAALEKKGEVR
jgi:AAA15 family ATPase/GTPase